jgi:uncharacterized membrane protein
MAKAIKKDLQDVEKNKVTAAMSYIWIVSLYGLLFRKDSDFIQWHAKQGTFLFVVEVVTPLFFGPLAVIFILPSLFFSLKGIYACLSGKYWQMPWIGEWIHKQNI